MYSRLAFSLCSSAPAGLLPSTTVQRSPSFRDGFTGCRFQGWCLLSRALVPLPLCWITGLCCFMWFFQFRRIMGLSGCGFAGWLFNSFLEFSLHLNFLPALAFPFRRVINLLNRIIINSPSVLAWSASQRLCFLSEAVYFPTNSHYCESQSHCIGYEELKVSSMPWLDPSMFEG